jgi:hypothetical protein
MRNMTCLPRLPSLVLWLPLAIAPLACAEPAAGDELPEPAEDPDPLMVPTDEESLLAWLAAEPYLDWPGESAIHPSTGPHFGSVRTWVSPALEQSLEDGAEQHPAGAAAVKELYGRGQTRRGWSVMVKTDDDSAGGDGWYWFERFNGSTYGDGNGVSGCTGCHGGGDDYVLTPFPLQ